MCLTTGYVPEAGTACPTAKLACIGGAEASSCMCLSERQTVSDLTGSSSKDGSLYVVVAGEWGGFASADIHDSAYLPEILLIFELVYSFLSIWIWCGIASVMEASSLFDTGGSWLLLVVLTCICVRSCPSWAGGAFEICMHELCWGVSLMWSIPRVAPMPPSSDRLSLFSASCRDCKEEWKLLSCILSRNWLQRLGAGHHSRALGRIFIASLASARPFCSDTSRGVTCLCHHFSVRWIYRNYLLRKYHPRVGHKSLYRGRCFSYFHASYVFLIELAKKKIDIDKLRCSHFDPRMRQPDGVNRCLGRPTLASQRRLVANMAGLLKRSFMQSCGKSNFVWEIRHATIGYCI